MVRAAEERTSTKVSSISMMIIRIIFDGSSALSSKSVTLAAMMSRVREKIPMGKNSLALTYGLLPAGPEKLAERGGLIRMSRDASTFTRTGAASTMRGAALRYRSDRDGLGFGRA